MISKGIKQLCAEAERDIDAALREHQEAGDHKHGPTDEQDLVPSALVRQNCKRPHSWGSYAQA